MKGSWESKNPHGFIDGFLPRRKRCPMTGPSNSEIQRAQDDFREAWESGKKPELAKYVRSVNPTELYEYLQALIPIDIEFRAVSGEIVDYKNYESLGEHAARIAAAFFSIDETPGPDEQKTIQSSLLDFPAASKSQDFADRIDPTNKVVGKYKLIQQIGAGGMGAVWMAQQEQPVRRRVALKVIRANLGSSESIARFEAERQALAMMNHPNIAQVLDAGTLDDGSPFFVMELVKGIPLTRYCNENRLDIRKRLELMIPVCDAIQHAHQKGIIHRDIKPTNILVSVRDDQPVPKVIDFGLAKALEHQHKLTEQTMLTEQGRVVGTLQYMSPEQAGSNELDIDARTDIYSLGVVLYQLLTGSTPLKRDVVANHTLLQIINIICESELTRPSARLKQDAEELNVASRQRQIEPNRLIQLLKGELDWVAMQALEKDRTKRYQTANSLAEDLKRFLNHEPVQARPPSTAYLVKKFVVKHRGWVGSAILATGLLLGGIVTSTYYAIDANRQKHRADNQLEVYKALFSSANPLTGASKGMTASELLQKAETVVYEKMKGDPIGQAELLHLIGTTLRGQGQIEAAIHALQTAWDLRIDCLGPDHLLTLETQSELAIAYQTQSLDRMLELMNDVYERRSQLLPEDCAELFETRHLLATAYFVAYKEKKKQGDEQQRLIDRALLIFEENFRIQTSTFGSDNLDTLKTLTNLANAHLKKGNIQRSIELGKTALNGWQHQVDAASSESSRNSAWVRLLITKNNYAEALEQSNDLEAAIKLYRETLQQKERHYDPGHMSWRTTLRLLIVCMIKAGKTESAHTLFRELYLRVQQSEDVFDRVTVLKKMKQELQKALHENEIDAAWLDDV